MICSITRIALIFCAQLALQCAAAFGQVGGRPSTFSLDIHGQVRHAQDGAPADHVLVRLESFDSGGAVQEMFTDRTGKFRFSSLARAQYVVTVHAPGFRDARQRVDLQTTSSSYVVLQLVPEAISSDAPPPEVIDAKAPPEALLEFERATEALSGGRKDRLAEGIRHLVRAIVIYPNFLEAELRLGTAYMDAAEWDKAERALVRALEIDSKTPNAWFALGELYLQQKRYDEAVNVLREGLKYQKSSWRGHLTLGRVYWEKGDLAQAGRQVGLTIELNPDLPAAHLLAGNILLRARKPDDAQAQFEEYLRLDPGGELAGQVRDLIERIKRDRRAAGKN